MQSLGSSPAENGGLSLNVTGGPGRTWRVWGALASPTKCFKGSLTGKVQSHLNQKPKAHLQTPVDCGFLAALDTKRVAILGGTM